YEECHVMFACFKRIPTRMRCLPRLSCFWSKVKMRTRSRKNLHWHHGDVLPCTLCLQLDKWSL
ncbi:hypothetical protein S245_044015, partial [Arachis hypogaea]